MNRDTEKTAKDGIDAATNIVLVGCLISTALIVIAIAAILFAVAWKVVAS